MSNIFIFDTINNKTVNKVVKGIVKAQNSKSDTITVYINSEGGDDECDYAIYEALRLSGKTIITHAVKTVYSSAVSIYLAGDRRYATNYSQFLIHEPYDEVECKLHLKSYKHSYNKLLSMKKDYFSFIAERSNLTVEDIHKYVNEAYKKDWYFKAHEAINYGIVTDIGFPMSGVDVICDVDKDKDKEEEEEESEEEEIEIEEEEE